jgi:hypothetical protein
MLPRYKKVQFLLDIYPLLCWYDRREVGGAPIFIGIGRFSRFFRLYYETIKDDGDDVRLQNIH